MNLTISLPFLYRLNGGGYLIAGKEQDMFTGRERKVDNRRVSIAGEQFFCGGRAVPYQRAEEAERQKNSILSDKVATFPVYFKFVSNRRAGELHFRL